MGTEKRNLIKPFEIQGYWWLPEKADRKIPGTVKFSGTKIILELLGTFIELQEFQSISKIDVILGVSINGKELTLHKCTPGKFNLNVPGISETTFHAINLFVGVHFQNSDEIKFKSMLVEYSEVDEWLGLSGFDADITKLISEKEFQLTHKRIPEIEFQISDNVQVVMGFGLTIDTNIIGQKKYSLIQYSQIELDFNPESSVDESFSILHDIQNFFTLATLASVHTIRITAKSEKNKKITQQKTEYPEIEVFKSHRDPIEINDSQARQFMLFSYKDIHENIENIFKKWFENKKTLQPIYNLYFELIYNKHLATETKFLILAQAVESYHRRVSDETQTDTESYNSKLTEILDAIPETYREWLSGQLTYSNELTLRQRLKKLLEEFPFVLDEQSLKQNKFIQYVIDHRNYLTHYDKNTTLEIDYNAMFYVSQRLAVLLESALLKELGFSIEKIRELVQKSKDIKGLKYEKHT